MENETDWLAVYQSSLYAFAHGPNWLRFSLEGDGPVHDLDGSLTLISAWNPMSEERPLPWNRAANARLLRQLVAEGVPWGPAWGSSLPGVEPSWKEDGFVLFNQTSDAVAALGKQWGQRALVHLEQGKAYLLFCEEARLHPCGFRPR